MHTLDLRQVEVFYYVAKLRSFSKAAEALLLTQPTISGHIKTLEESLALVLYDRFAEDELVLAVARDHPWAQQGAVPLMALATEPFIQRERGSGSRLVMEQTLKQHGFEPTLLRTVAEMGSTEAIKQGIKAGIGVSVLSGISLIDEIKGGSVEIVTIEGVTLQRHFYIIRHRGRTLSPLCQTFERFLHRIDPVSLLPQDM